MGLDELWDQQWKRGLELIDNFLAKILQDSVEAGIITPEQRSQVIAYSRRNRA